MQFASKAKGRRRNAVKITEIDSSQNGEIGSFNKKDCVITAPKNSILSMKTRSATVNLNTSTCIQLKPVNYNNDDDYEDDSDNNNDTDDDDIEHNNKDDKNVRDKNCEKKNEVEFQTLGQPPKFQTMHPQKMDSDRGIVTQKSSEVILGYVLKHVDRSMIELNKFLIRSNSRASVMGGSSARTHSTVYGNHSYTDAHRADRDGEGSDWIRHEGGDNGVGVWGDATGHGIGEEEGKGGRMSGYSYQAHLLCKCIFTLFEVYPISIPIPVPIPLPAMLFPTPATTSSSSCSSSSSFSSSSTSINNDDAVSSGAVGVTAGVVGANTGPLMLKNISARRRGHVLSMASKYLSHCNRDCARLLREAVAISKERMIRKSIEKESTDRKKRRRVGTNRERNGKKKRTKNYGFSSSSSSDVDLSDELNGCKEGSSDDSEDEKNVDATDMNSRKYELSNNRYQINKNLNIHNDNNNGNDDDGIPTQKHRVEQVPEKLKSNSEFEGKSSQPISR